MDSRIAGLKNFARTGLLGGTLLFICGVVTGCNDFINPGEVVIIDEGKAPLVQPILDAVAPGVEPSDRCV